MAAAVIQQPGPGGGTAPAGPAAGGVPVAPAPAAGATKVSLGAQPVRYFNQTMMIMEAENFSTAGPWTGCRGGGGATGWSACTWGDDDNLFASDVSNVFLSRRAYLHADANATLGETARAFVPVAAAGTYHVLIRYEAGYRFSSPFKVEIEQGGDRRFEKVYGLKTTPKVGQTTIATLAQGPPLHTALLLVQQSAPVPAH